MKHLFALGMVAVALVCSRPELAKSPNVNCFVPDQFNNMKIDCNRKNMVWEKHPGYFVCRPKIKPGPKKTK